MGKKTNYSVLKKSYVPCVQLVSASIHDFFLMLLQYASEKP